MSEISTTLIVIAAVLFVIVQGLGVASFVMLLMQGRRMKELTDKNASLVGENEKLKRGQRVLGKLVNKLRHTQLKQAAARAKDKAEMVKFFEAHKTEVVDGQMKMAELFTTGMKASTEYLNTVSKAITDSIFDAVNKNTEDVLKLNTENSQKVYDATVIMIQMMNGLMTAMGYRPSAPVPESGLEDPKRGQNYNKPPAPVDEDGLTYAK
jgi:predicted SnoaL-like aldol condensation-catalyzing enzyme